MNDIKEWQKRVTVLATASNPRHSDPGPDHWDAFRAAPRLDTCDRVAVFRDAESSARFQGGDPVDWIAAYLAALPPGFRASVAVIVARDGETYLAVWSPVPRPAIAPWGWTRAPRGVDVAAALYVHYIPPSRPPLTLDTMQRTEAPAAVEPAGLLWFDGMMRGGGLPRGARVVLQAPVANAKTATALNIAVAFAIRYPDRVVAWLATRDEPAESIAARLRQMGCPNALTVVDGREHTLDAVLRVLPGDAVLAVDTLQRVRVDGAAGEESRVSRALELLEMSGLTVIVTCAVVRGAERRDGLERARGGSEIEGGATVLLDLALDGDDLTVTPLKNRHGDDQAQTHLHYERATQRVVHGSPDLDALVLAAVAAGATSARQVEAQTEGHPREAVRAAVARLVAEGRIVATGQRRRLSLPGGGVP